VVDAADPRVGLDRAEPVDLVEQGSELVLTVGGQEEVVERVETAPLVGIRDSVAVAEHLVEQLALGAAPPRDGLAHLPVERSELHLHLAEVGEQLAGHRGELLVAVPLGGRVEHVDLARLRPGDDLVESCPLRAQLVEPPLRVGLGALDDLAQQVDEGVEP